MDRVDRTGSDEVARAPALQGLVFAPPDLGPGNGGLPMSSVSTVLEGPQEVVGPGTVC